MNHSLPLPSDRSFGWTFAAFFLLAGFVFHPLAFALAALVAAVTVIRSEWLAPYKRAWMKLAEILNQVVSPVVLAVIFFGLFTPVAWVMRLAGRDALSRSFDPSAPTYWINREPPGPAEDSFKDPF